MEGCSSRLQGPPPQQPAASSSGYCSREKASTSSQPCSSSREALRLERRRREKMGESYSVLLSMVPSLFPRATRTKIVDETVAYIGELQEVIRAMEIMKSAGVAPPPASTSCRMPLLELTTVSGGSTTFFGMRFPAARPGLVARVFHVFDAHGAEVLNATVARIGPTCTDLTVTAEVDGEALEGLKRDLLVVLG